MDADVVIVGGGVIGTAIAWRAASAGLSVTLVDPRPGRGQGQPGRGGHARPRSSESVFGEDDLLALNLLAVGRFPGFNAELEDATGHDHRPAHRGHPGGGLRQRRPGRAATGSPSSATRSACKAEALDAGQCRALEPFLAPATRGGRARHRRPVGGQPALPGRAAGRRGSAPVCARDRHGRRGGARARHRPPRPAPGTTRPGRPRRRGRRRLRHPRPRRRPRGRPPGVRPVKGQILRLRHPARLPRVATPHRPRDWSRAATSTSCPARTARLVVGATQEERDDRDVTAGAVHDLLRDAVIALPGDQRARPRRDQRRAAAGQPGQRSRRRPG